MLIQMKGAAFDPEQIAGLKVGSWKGSGGPTTGIVVYLKGNSTPVPIECENEENAIDVLNTFLTRCKEEEGREDPVLLDVRRLLREVNEKVVYIDRRTGDLDKASAEMKKKLVTLQKTVKKVDWIPVPIKVDTDRPLKITADWKDDEPGPE